MKKTNENGITLVALVITVIIMLILASVGINTGKGTIEYAKFNKIKSELTILQTKVNELNEKGNTDIGQKISNTQKEILNNEIVSGIIYKDKTEEEKKAIESGFRFISSNEIKSKLGLDGFDRSYLINVEYRYVVSCEGLTYKGITYYMIDQIDDGMYNVGYHNKNSNNGSFELSTKVVGDEYRIVVSDIKHDGYVSNWQVKYKLNTEENWQTSNQLEFAVEKAGTYIVNVVHGDEIDLGRKNIEISKELGWSKSKSVNYPQIMQGMNAIKFSEPEENKDGETVKTIKSDVNWYDYYSKKWANAQTEDGSMWVWIPRYAYKVVYNDPNDKSKGGRFDIVFLIGTTDNYYDENGKIQTAQRQTSENETIETDSTKTDKYTVHPAFTDESSISYVNGGWKEELTGIWVAKFEAGYFDKTSEQAKIKASSVNYSLSTVWTTAGKFEDARNYLDGIYGSNVTAIKYPTFQGEKYSMNYINHNDAFNISKALTENGNIYGLKNNSTDSHLMKNSEWGAVSYLGQSKYGLNGTNIRINNVNVNDNTNFVYAITGHAAKAEDAQSTGKDNTYKWTEKEGQTASCTGTIYGIYDMSGGVWERTAAIVNNGDSNLNSGKAIIAASNDGKSSEYVTIYPKGEKSGQTIEAAGKDNYAVNNKIYGDAIRETSVEGAGQTSWYSDNSGFVGAGYPFFRRGGSYFDTPSTSGLFHFNSHPGSAPSTGGFRSVLVSK